MLRHLRTLSLVLLSATSGAINFGYMAVQTVQVCMDKIMLATPGVPDPTVYIDRIAWPVGSVIMPEPLTANEQSPINVVPELICMGGCIDPPCWHVSACAAPDLFWAARYQNLSVPTNFQMQLPDMPVGTTPASLLVLIDTVGPSPSPTSSPSVSPSVSPSATIPISPSASSSSYPQRAPVLAVGGISESPHATPAAVVFGLLFGIATLVIFGCWHRSQKAECPYCALRVAGGAANMRSHLKTCQDHLALFQPFVLETVRQLPTHQQTIAVHVPSGTEETEDVVARAEITGPLSQGVKD